MSTSIPEDERQALEPCIPGTRVLELGNKKNSTGTYRDFYVNDKKAVYKCADWNGQDGAYALDFNYSLAPSDFDEQTGFDMLTNFGFSEHVTDQVAFWRNHHDLTRPGGIMCGVTPHPGDWPHHGILQPTITFYAMLAEKNNYKIHALWVNENRKRRTVCYRLERLYVDDPFYMPKGWGTHIIPTPQPSDAAFKNSRIVK